MHFFEPSVLDHVKEDPNYNFYGNRFDTKHDAPVEPSGIQQFMWASKNDGSPCIAALLPHLMTLSYNDQLLWQSKELDHKESTEARIEPRYVGPILYGQWPDTGFDQNKPRYLELQPCLRSRGRTEWRKLTEEKGASVAKF